MRNRIGREALLEPPFIHIHQHGHQWPSLLATCKVIRQEGLPLFLLENEFILNIDDFDVTWTSRFLDVVGDMVTSIGGTCLSGVPEDVSCHNFYPGVTPLGLPNWPNLIGWLKACHTGGCVGWDREWDQASSHAEEMAMNGVFGILYELAGQPWERVLAVLEHFHTTLTFVDSQWA